MVLVIPTFVAKITTDNLKIAFESIHQSDVDNWIKEFIGASILSKRKQAFPKILEQK